MNRGIVGFGCICLFFLLITASACVAPPKPSVTSQGSSGSSAGSSGLPAPTDATTPLYVSIETPYGATAPPTAAPVATTAAPEEWVEIFRSTRSYGYNTTAVSFDLKNPPMVINFSVIPVNVTGTKVTTDKFGTKGDITVSYDYYSPYAWFELTVRNKNSGKILLQDGFGNSYGKQYSAQLNRTVKVLNRENLLIEMNGNQVTATVDMHVKKNENINTM